MVAAVEFEAVVRLPEHFLKKLEKTGKKLGSE
jgi:hypothetical protein